MEEGKGFLWIKKPNLFKLHIISPYENILIFDGKTLWNYSPNIQQVIIYSLEKILKNNPMILLINDPTSILNRYQIKQEKDNFFLYSNKENHEENLDYFVIKIDKEGTIKNLNTIEKNGKKNILTLKNAKNNIINTETFIFKLPKNVTIDDQR